MINRGFTLIETLIYIALFSIIMTGGFIAAFQILQGQSTLSNRATIQAEGNFVSAKINWAMTGITTINTPAIGATSSTLTVTKIAGNQVTIKYNAASSSIEMQESAGPIFFPITTANVKVSGLVFSATSTGILGITASTTINNKLFTLTKYVRN